MNQAVWEQFSKFKTGRREVDNIIVSQMDSAASRYFRLAHGRFLVAAGGSPSVPELEGLSHDVKDSFAAQTLLNALGDGATPDAPTLVSVVWSQMQFIGEDSTIQLLCEVCEKLMDRGVQNKQRFTALITELSANVDRTKWNFWLPDQTQNYVGIRNKGCPCFVNSAMQQLFQIPAGNRTIKKWCSSRFP
jgi:hypothetical protein